VHLKVIEWWKLSLANYTYLQLIVLWNMKSRCCLDLLPLQNVYCESNCNTKDMFDQSGTLWMILYVNLQMWQVSCSTSPLFPSLCSVISQASPTSLLCINDANSFKIRGMNNLQHWTLKKSWMPMSKFEKKKIKQILGQLLHWKLFVLVITVVLSLIHCVYI
jgi:hypothetical protein